jgi:hypothetical protein
MRFRFGQPADDVRKFFRGRSFKSDDTEMVCHRPLASLQSSPGHAGQHLIQPSPPPGMTQTI